MPHAKPADRLLAAFGPEYCLTQAADIAPGSADPWHLYAGRAAAILRPRTAEQVSAMVRFCASHGIVLVPQGGNTGLVGGGIPDDTGEQVILSLSRLNRIRELDADNYTATVEAGCILADVQSAAAGIDRLFPLSFGAEGSCQIGGVLSTNAGGSSVLRYGNARDLVLGLEVVLADGTLWHGLRKLRKNNTGYDLKQLFIGAEGTLGIITAAVVKLFPRPRSGATLIAALSTLEAAPRLLAMARDASSDALSAFELISRRLVDLSDQHLEKADCVPETDAEWFALLEFTGSDTDEALAERVQALLETAFEAGLVMDASVASNLAQREKMWRLRDGVAETQIKNGAVIYFDVSVPVSQVPAFIRQASDALRAMDPQIDINAFGHVGDGNIHYNLLQPAHREAERFLARKPDYERIVYDCVARLDGSFSAEHGIGRAKTAQMEQAKPAVEIALMRAIRDAISGPLMNPGKLVP